MSADKRIGERLPHEPDPFSSDVESWVKCAHCKAAYRRDADRECPVRLRAALTASHEQHAHARSENTQARDLAAERAGVPGRGFSTGPIYTVTELCDVIDELRGELAASEAARVRGEGEVVALRARVGELEATLAAERGDVAGALPGWIVLGCGYSNVSYRKAFDGLHTGHINGFETGPGWRWSVNHFSGGMIASGTTPTAREAMRAADAALVGKP